jgi:streptogramin lyase
MLDHFPHLTIGGLNVAEMPRGAVWVAPFFCDYVAVIASWCHLFTLVQLPNSKDYAGQREIDSQPFEGIASESGNTAA